MRSCSDYVRNLIIFFDELFFAFCYAATYESVEEDVSSAEDYYPVAGHVVGPFSNLSLDCEHNSAAEYHCHEDT